jgi:hypothetical protein
MVVRDHKGVVAGFYCAFDPSRSRAVSPRRSF